jgi:DNA-binding beta-propeller fold protein YncE
MTLRKGLSWLSIVAFGVSACAEPEAEGAVGENTDELLSFQSTANEDTFTAFESGQVRPLAISADGNFVYAVNTPDNRLEIFRAQSGVLTSVGSVMVGLEPVALALRSATEVWVVNHLSDSVSIVDVSAAMSPRVTRTLLVGDEPRDIVFAQSRAFISTAHRGQNTGRDPQLTTPGVGRADVWVFNPSSLGSTLAGTPLTVISLFTDTPRALSVSADGKTVFAAGFHTGNRTTVIPERIVTNFGGLPEPLTNVDGVTAPWNSLVVKYRAATPDGQFHWHDAANRVWDPYVNFTLPDRDVFAIDAAAAVPAGKTGAGSTFSGVGTVLFNMAVNPVNGKVYVSNLEARNEVRFEGHNHFGGNGSVRGHIAESRISVLESSGTVRTRHLNKHLDYSRDGTPTENLKSVAFPTGMAVSSNGQLLYVAALGSSELAIYNTSEIENDSFVPATSNQVKLSGGGPTGVVLDNARGYAYVLTRFDNAISTVRASTKAEVGHVKMYNPEPPSITRGRRFLYDAQATSTHGDSACASCHIFGDFDSLAWDLGDPDGVMVHNPGPFAIPVLPELMPNPDFHPLKGPMTTQSLRGMANHGPMHWRGDRTGGNDVAASAQPNTGTFDERAAFKKFNVAFPGLLGAAGELSNADMEAFTTFMLQVMYPPNPIRNLDNSLTANQQAGRDFYFNNLLGIPLPTDTFQNCNGCHTLDPLGNFLEGERKFGFFGSNGSYSFEAESQFFKVPHLRNAYQKVGMFGGVTTFGLPIDTEEPRPPTAAPLPPPFNDDTFKGDQVRGFGFLHSGESDTVYRFLGATLFAQRPLLDPFPNPFGIPIDQTGIQLRRNLEAFVHAYDSNLAPVVGQQITLTSGNASVVNPRINLLKSRAFFLECELIVRGRQGNSDVGFLYSPLTGLYERDRILTLPYNETQLRSLTATAPLTFTCVPPGSGRRLALDRDSDGLPNGND